MSDTLHASNAMRYGWIVDVLCDLKAFASSNGMSVLAEHLDDTAIVAAAEIAQTGQIRAGEWPADETATGQLHRGPAASGHAW
jgi:hypothetical protein